MMIRITPHMRILVAVEPIDFRAGIDGLVLACRTRLQADPFSGALFVFSNRTRTLQACERQVLLMGGDPSRAHTAPAWRALSLAA